MSERETQMWSTMDAQSVGWKGLKSSAYFQFDVALRLNICIISSKCITKNTPGFKTQAFAH